MRETPVRIGSYEIVMELAAGGMAATYIAHKRGETFFERLVVVKRIHPWLLQDPKSGDMLREEARLGAALQHPHVVHIEDVTVSGGEVCLIMPYVESLSLGALLASVRRCGDRIPSTIASRILLDVLSGLHAAHEAKDLRGQPLEIVHRDVSPNNVLVGTEGQSRIIDFGIARAKSRLCQTQSGDMKGTIAYMSPEQLRRRELDRRADVFAAGAILYELLAGERLFDGRDEADILIGVLADDIPSLHARFSDITPDIDTVLARALARECDERFPTAQAFAEALETALPPASSADVAAFVHRFGENEFTRRREAIRIFVEQQHDEVSSPVLPTNVTTSAHFNPHDERKRPTLRTLVIAVVLATCITLALFRVSRGTQADESVTLPQLPPSALSHEARNGSVEQSPHAAKGNAPSATMSGLNMWGFGSPSASFAPNPSVHPSLDSSAMTKSLSSAVPRLGPQHEKVDKRRGSELQENPYR